MDRELLFQLLTILVKMVVAGFVAYILPIVKKWIETVLQNKWAMVAVQAAQQTLQGGGVKKEYAIELLKQLAAKWKIDLTDAEIDALIEAAVNEYKGGYKSETSINS